jgi:NTP pyrophosphatase (non-canonical NTP hydrolase)
MDTHELREAYGFAPLEEKDKLSARVDALEKKIIEESRREWDRLANAIHPINVDKGFWSEPVMMDKYVAKMMLVVTETAEVVEALRKSQGKDKVTEEFADIFIRALDLYGKLVEDGEADPALYGVLLDKLEVNKNRPPKHGNRWG